MAAWYSKFYAIHSKPYDDLDDKLIAGIREKMLALQSDQPIASIVAIAKNEETRLPSCLWSLSENVCSYPIEIICVDNDSTDRTAEVIQKLGVKYLLQTKKGHGNARQMGLENARGKYYICIDSDTIYPKRYIETMIRALERPGVIGAIGLTGYFPDKHNSRAMIAVYQVLRDVHLKMLFRKRPELVVRGMSFGFRTELGLKYGFRTDLRRGEDGSMALSLKNEGPFVLVSSNKARPVTETKHTDTDRSLAHNFWMKFTGSLKNLSSYFKKQEHYQDEDSNLIDPGKK